MKKPVILSPARLAERASQAQLFVVEERQRLAIEEANHQHHVRAACLNRLTASASVTVQDLIESADNKIKIKDLATLPREVARVVKKLKITNRTTGSEDMGNRETVQTVEVELAHHLEYDEKIGKYLGLWANDNKHLHLHQHAPGAEIPKKLADLSPEEIRALRTRLEKEVEMLSITTEDKK